VVLPVDSHVHTEWSWDALAGSMDRTCARAVELGLPGVAFTEHVDLTRWDATGAGAAFYARLGVAVDEDGSVTPPVFDAEGYSASVADCRERYPDLRILTGLEVGEPHWHPDEIAALVGPGRFDRVLGSLHGLAHGGGFAEPGQLFAERDRAEVLRSYLLEIAELARSPGPFAVLAHIDYPLRYWPAETPFDPADFEEEFRHALAAVAGSGRALEINTSLPMDPAILRWWHEAGGDAVTFGSDAHSPEELARHFGEVADLAVAVGFGPAASPFEPWGRVS
jgi:histidinol-phosphatase (PHP family)